jgi:hypothetical protein
MESMGPLLANAWNFGSPFQLVPFDRINGQACKGSPIDEARTASFDILSRMDDRQNGVAGLCGRGSAGRAWTIAGAGCRRQRDSSGAGECARAERLGQRSQRHRQCCQSTGAAVADDHSGYAAQRILFRRLPVFAGAARGQAQTTAIRGTSISSWGTPRDRPGARPADRPRRSQHLQGMLSVWQSFNARPSRSTQAPSSPLSPPS